VGELPSEPPHDDKEPEDEDEKNDIPQPATPLAPSHVVHAPERASEYARRFCECVVHLAELNRRIADLVPNADGDLFEQFHFCAESLDGIVVLAFEVVRKACACERRAIRRVVVSRVWRRASRVGRRWCVGRSVGF